MGVSEPREETVPRPPDEQNQLVGIPCVELVVERAGEDDADEVAGEQHHHRVCATGVSGRSTTRQDRGAPSAVAVDAATLAGRLGSRNAFVIVRTSPPSARHHFRSAKTTSVTTCPASNARAKALERKVASLTRRQLTVQRYRNARPKSKERERYSVGWVVKNGAPMSSWSARPEAAWERRA